MKNLLLRAPMPEPYSAVARDWMWNIIKDEVKPKKNLKRLAAAGLHELRVIENGSRGTRYLFGDTHGRFTWLLQATDEGSHFAWTVDAYGPSVELDLELHLGFAATVHEKDGWGEPQSLHLDAPFKKVIKRIKYIGGRVTQHPGHLAAHAVLPVTARSHGDELVDQDVHLDIRVAFSTPENHTTISASLLAVFPDVTELECK